MAPAFPFNDGPAQTRGRETLAARTFERGLEYASITSGKGGKSPEKRALAVSLVPPKANALEATKN